MKRILTLGLALLMLMLMLAGCSTEVTEYRQQQPPSTSFTIFRAEPRRGGMVQDRNGKQLRRFHVEIDGDVVGDTLTLHERFVYDDGEKQQRYGAFAAPAITVIRAPPGISKGGQRPGGRQCLSLALQHERRGQRQPVAAAL